MESPKAVLPLEGNRQGKCSGKCSCAAEAAFRVRRRGENRRFAGDAAALAKAGRADGDRGGDMGNSRGLRTKSRRAQRNCARRAIRRADGFVVCAARRLRASIAIFRLKACVGSGSFGVRLPKHVSGRRRPSERARRAGSWPRPCRSQGQARTRTPLVRRPGAPLRRCRGRRPSCPRRPL